MGCGKSSLGKKLAKKMDLNFLDLDRIIELNEDLSVNEIFKIKGEDYFRQLETEWLSSFEGDGNIISLGGGTPCFNDNIKQINSIGTSVYLQMNVGLLTDRLINSKQKRPLIEEFKHDKIKLTSVIEKLLKSRTVFYNEANVIFEASNVSVTKLNALISIVENQHEFSKKSLF